MLLKFFNNIDKLTDSKKINPSLKKQFTQKIVRNFLKQRGVKMNDAYYKKMLKAVQNIMQMTFKWVVDTIMQIVHLLILT